MAVSGASTKVTDLSPSPLTSSRNVLNELDDICYSPKSGSPKTGGHSIFPDEGTGGKGARVTEAGWGKGGCAAAI